MEPIYFSKVEFRECGLMYKNQQFAWDEERIISINLIQKEIFIKHTRTGNDTASYIYPFQSSFVLGFPDDNKPTRIIYNSKNRESRESVNTWGDRVQIINSRTIYLTDEEIRKLLPYCNALDFVIYRDREMSRNDPGYLGYRDQTDVRFTGTTNSYIPEFSLPMDCIYDKEHEWPSERLYEYIYTHLI